MRTYVVCIDGTWNNPNQTDKDPVLDEEAKTETNVLLTYRFLTGNNNANLKNGTVCPIKSLDGGDGNSVDVIYLYGVGSSRIEAVDLYEGATGTGISERIWEGYRFLAERHVLGDKIFIFGFSRGAFAARSLAGFLQYVGLPKEPRTLSNIEIGEAYSWYRFRKGAPKSEKSMGRDVAVDFIGVWDTVGALAFKEFNDYHLLSPESTKQVAHALALDEQRETFSPTYWESAGQSVIDEAWFSGVHTNIGGGYIDQGLSNIALAWVASKAIEAGLPLSKDYIRGWADDAVAGARDSYSEFIKQFGVLSAWANFKCQKISRAISAGQKIHRYVFDRITALAHVQPPYVPAAHLDGNNKSFPADMAFWQNSDRIVSIPDYVRN